jgi:2-polyprenyl-3-methyl-5-hydroxy-6-metoxy-1,4-benzoquinol methylase
MKDHTRRYQSEMRWQVISEDPCDPRVYAARRKILSELISTKKVFSRTAYLVELCKGKKILDVGIVEHNKEAYLADRWLHRHLSNAAHSCLGVDVMKHELEYLKDRDFNVVYHDFCESPMPGEYDVIVCGDVLEHVSNSGSFLSNLNKSLSSDGILLLSLPNPWYLNCLLKNIWGSHIFVDNADHVAWHDYHTILELGIRCGLSLRSIQGVSVMNNRSLAAFLLSRLAPVAVSLGFKSLLFCKTVIYELEIA